MKIKGVIFDLDGTLYDNTKLAGKVVVSNIFNLRLLAAERLAHLKMSGRFYGERTFDEILKRISMKTGIGLFQVKRWYLKVFMPSQVRALKNNFKAKSWTIPILNELKSRGIKTACFSEYICVNDKLEAIGIDPALFDVVIDAPAAGGLKPCRRAFEAVAEKMGLDPSEILVVGDREDTDGAGAEASGMNFLLVPKTDSGDPGILQSIAALGK